MDVCSGFVPGPCLSLPGSPSAPAAYVTWSPSPGAPPQRCSSPRSWNSQNWTSASWKPCRRTWLKNTIQEAYELTLCWTLVDFHSNPPSCKWGTPLVASRVNNLLYLSPQQDSLVKIFFTSSTCLCWSPVHLSSSSSEAAWPSTERNSCSSTRPSSGIESSSSPLS